MLGLRRCEERRLYQPWSLPRPHQRWGCLRWTALKHWSWLLLLLLLWLLLWLAEVLSAQLGSGIKHAFLHLRGYDLLPSIHHRGFCFQHKLVPGITHALATTSSCCSFSYRDPLLGDKARLECELFHKALL